MNTEQSIMTRQRASTGRTLAMVMLVAFGGAGVVLAQSSSTTYSIPRQSIDGGTQRASSATYSVTGTVGQPDAGPAVSAATFTVRGGFHRASPAAPLPDAMFSNGFEP
ncbi:MAG: hypothetical protein ACK59M_15290 [Pseudomonadota bacterium]|jgi:hypothetical protein